MFIIACGSKKIQKISMIRTNYCNVPLQVVFYDNGNPGKTNQVESANPLTREYEIKMHGIKAYFVSSI